MHFLFTLFFSLPLIFTLVATSISHFCHRRYNIISFMFFFQQNWSPFLFISRSSPFPVIQVNVDIKIKWKERLIFFVCFFLSKSLGSHAIYRWNELGAWNADFHLSYNILLPWWADASLPSTSPRVCTVSVRSYADVMTNFSCIDGLPNFLSYAALLSCVHVELHF